MSMKLSAAMGFAAKAGRVKSGEFAADKSVKSGNARLIILDSAASENTIKRWQDACSFRNVPLLCIDDAAAYMGKKSNKVFAITDDNFAELISNAAAGAADDKNTTREV